jgi:hypothetical protein
MIEPVLDSRVQGFPLVQLTTLAAIAAGAVAGAVAGWLSKHNVGLSLCTFMIGIMGGLLLGTAMGEWLYVAADGSQSMVQTKLTSLSAAALAGLAGSFPTALVISSVVIFITLRHVKNRPPRIKTGLMAAVAGTLAGTGVAVVRLMI